MRWCKKEDETFASGDAKGREIMGREIAWERENRETPEKTYGPRIYGQLDPHFLFNTLNLMARLAEKEKAPETEETILLLAKYLRHLLRRETGKDLIPLRQELEAVRHLLGIFGKRFGSKLEYGIFPEEKTLFLFVPFLILLPLVEKALLHGAEESSGPVRIEVAADTTETDLHLTVRETGPTLSAPYDEGAREFLPVRKRLEYHYSHRGTLLVSGNAEEGLLTTVTLPLE